ncbi:hypothetical protein ACNOYE_05340 [Nannocystaceae bacterium ST9]
MPYSSDHLEGFVETATFIEHDDGRHEFVLRGRDDDGTIWEAHLYSREGRHFSGSMISEEWSHGLAVSMEMWLSPTEPEWLLLGTWQEPGEDPVNWRITLSAPDD